MTEEKPREKYRKEFAASVAKKHERKKKAMRQKDQSFWYGFGVFGIVGWSVMIPLLVMLAIGILIDAHLPSRISWTLTFLLIGTALGCLNAWYWVTKERNRIDEENKHE